MVRLFLYFQSKLTFNFYHYYHPPQLYKFNNFNESKKEAKVYLWKSPWLPLGTPLACVATIENNVFNW